MSTLTTVMAWASSLAGSGINEELAAFTQQQMQAGHVHDTDTNFAAAFIAFSGAAIPSVPTVSMPSSPGFIHGAYAPATYLLSQSGGQYLLRDCATDTLAGTTSTDLATLLNQAIAAHADGNGAIFAVAPNASPYTLTHPVVSDADYISIVSSSGHAESVKFAMSSASGSLFVPDTATTYGTVVSALAVGTAGSGYPTNGTFLCNLVGGTYTTQATCNVTVSAGALSAVAIVNAGAGIVQPGTTPSVDLTPLGAPTVAGSITVTLNGAPTGWTAGQSAALFIFGNNKNVQGDIMRGITLIGNCFNGGGNLAGKPYDGVWMRGSNNGLFDAHIKQFAQDCVRLDSWDYTATTVFDNLMDNVYAIQANRDGVYVGLRISDSEIRNCRVDGLLGTGAKLSRYGFYSQGGEIKFQNCHPYGCTQDGFHVDRGSGLQIIGGKSENNGRANIYINMGGSSTYFDVVLIGVSCYGGGPSANDLLAQKVNNLQISGCTFYSPCAKNVNLINVNKGTIDNVTCRNSASTATCFYGDGTTSYLTIKGGTFTASAANQIALDLAGQHNLVDGVGLEGAVALEIGSSLNTISINRVTGVVTDSGSSNRFFKNDGYVTENSGTATVAQNATSTTVNHGLAGAPTVVTPMPTSDPGTDYWVSNITATSFQINLHTANASGNVTFLWRAQIGA